MAQEYNSRTTHCSRTGENLKAQWENMKKVARKDAANNRRHMIQTGGGPPLPPKKEDPFLQRILSLILTSAVGLFNPYDNDSVVPAVQNQAAFPAVQSQDFPEPLSQRKDPLQISDIDVSCDTQEFETKDWGNNTPQLLKTPVSLALRIDSDGEKNIEKETPARHRTWVSRRRPTHTTSCSSLEQLHKKKIEAIELQKKLAVEEMERSKFLHDLDIQIKKQILKQEKIKTNLLLIRRRKLMKK